MRIVKAIKSVLCLEMSKDCLSLADVKKVLVKGERLELGLDETGCLWSEVASPFIEREGGELKRITVEPYLGLDNRRGMGFSLWVIAMRSRYGIDFVTYNCKSEGILCTGNLRVTGGNMLVRGGVESIAKKMLGKPNHNLEKEVGLREGSLRVDINDRRSLIWLDI